MRARWRVLIALLGAAVAAGVVPTLRSAALSGGQRQVARHPEALEVYFNSPVLVRAGERVRLPVRVVCAMPGGAPCTSTSTLGIREADGPWQQVRAAASPSLIFDLTAAVLRAGAPGASGALDFFVRATGPEGTTSSVPAEEAASPTRLFVVPDLPVIRAPGIPFGRTRAAKTALYLPWGSGPRRAGLEPGRESATLGPSSFDVDAKGRVFLADPLQGRIAVFDHERLVEEIPVGLGPRADLALTAQGAIVVLDRGERGFAVRRIEDGHRLVSTVPIAGGTPVQIRTLGEEALVDLLPQDQWIRVDTSGSAATATVGRPFQEGELLRAASEDHVRLGLVAGGRVTDGVEVRFSQRVGEVALAEPDGLGGVWAVLHLSTSLPTPADQYQVVHVSRARIVETFAVGDSRFADTPPLSRFRLGHDGNLYQLMTFPEGMRIVRYDLGGES